MTAFQRPTTPDVDRLDHVWMYRLSSKTYICCLCGAVTKRPMPYRTPEDWMPELGYEKLTDEVRKRCPYISEKVSDVE